MLMLLATGYYYWTNYQAQKVLEGIYAEKSGYDTQIQVLKSNPEILAAEILLTKEEELKKTIEQSNPAIYLRELDRIYKAKGIYFEGFSYSK
jgi:DNA-binding MurR/RpiR family transcriptional regulator